MHEPLLYESHCHTPLCRHAVGEPEEYARAAQNRGLAGITFTCHGPTPREWGHCMKRREWPEYLQIVDRARQKFAGIIDVRTGVECDFMPGMEEYWREFLGQNPQLSHVLGSVHPQVADYRTKYWKQNPLDYARTYFDHLALAAQSGLFDTLSHPDLVKNSVAPEWDLKILMPHIEKNLDKIAQTGVAMELNTSGLQKTIREMNPAPEILRAMAVRKIPVVVGADAHVPERVGADFDQALEICAQAGFDNVSFFVARERRDVEIEAAQASLKRDLASD